MTQSNFYRTQQFIKFGVIKESPLAQFLQCNGYTMSEFSLQEASILL